MMNVLELALAIGLGTCVASIAVVVIYLAVMTSKPGMKLMAKWVKRYVDNFTETFEEMDL